MSIYHVKGSLLDADVDYYCHQVNCQGRMGSGIAKVIKEKWPVVYSEYIQKYNDTEDNILRNCGGFEHCPETSEVLLGDIQLVQVDKNHTVINMFAQEHYGYDGRRYTSYDGFWSCLGHIREFVPEGATIGFPSHIGCGLGGGNWEVIKTMIEQVLDEDYEVYIYYLEE